MAEAPAHSTVDRDRLTRLLEDERARFRDDHPRSLALYERAKASLLDGVPMNWMVEWASPFPLFVEEASGARFRCVDGHEYTDFCLGDTGAMAGHGPSPTIAAVERQMRRGITHMLPTEDAIWAGEELGRRFGLPLWQFTITATDANRFSIRLARQATGRSKVVVHDHCYHGSVDETFATLDADGRVVPSEGSVGPPVPPSETTRVVPFNDVDALERALVRPRRRGRARRACPDERRDRPARARLPRGAAGDHAADRDDPDHRRDPHDLRGARWDDAARRPRARHARDRQDDRRRDPGGDVRDDGRGRRPDPVDDAGADRRRRGRRDAGGLRAVARGDPGDARRGAHGRGVRADDPARRALGGGRQRRDLVAARSVARHAAGRSGGIPLRRRRRRATAPSRRPTATRSSRSTSTSRR